MQMPHWSSRIASWTQSGCGFLETGKTNPSPEQSLDKPIISQKEGEGNKRKRQISSLAAIGRARWRVGRGDTLPQPKIFGSLGPGEGGLTDIGTEELAHIEIVSAILYQLTKGLSIDEIKEGGLETYFVDHTTGIYPQAASGMPFSASTLQSTGDIICDLTEDLAAEQKARVTYDNILRLVDDPDVRDPIKFLREREIVHFQRFGEANRAEKSIGFSSSSGKKEQ